MVSTEVLPLYLPSSQMLCYNHLSLPHFFTSAVCHLLLMIVRKVGLLKKLQDDSSSHDSMKTWIIQHYALIWCSLITSPKGWQLDFWLCTLVFMDCLPIIISILYTILYAVSNQSSSSSFEEFELWNATGFMRKWSPAYQLNYWIMHYFEGCLVKHIYLLILFTLGITQSHKIIVTNLYCTRLNRI